MKFINRVIYDLQAFLKSFENLKIVNNEKIIQPRLRKFFWWEATLTGVINKRYHKCIFTTPRSET